MIDCLAIIDSKLKQFCLEEGPTLPLPLPLPLPLLLPPLDVGEESKGVTGALFEILRGCRLVGMELQRNENGLEFGLMSLRVGL